MKLLTIHCNYVEFAAVSKALKSAAPPEKQEQRIEECLLVLAATEKRDEGREKELVKKAAGEIADIAGKVKAERIVLYPYVHLVADPSSPSCALDVLEGTQKALSKRFEVVSAPFGWYKSFVFSGKGHPLSELSRELHAEGGEKYAEEPAALREEEKVRSEWFILTPKGEMVSAGKFSFKWHENLQKLWKYEMAKIRSVSSEPPHAKLMKQMELVDYEQGSDPGNLRYYPKGRLIKSLLELWINRRVSDYGGMEVETPVMYDYEHPALKSYLERFPARQYTIESAKKKFFLRFSACFGQFLTLANSQISYRDLPLGIYELTRYSFRLEKAGELVALRRLRAFTMPDLHTLCADMESAKKEFISQFKLCMSCMGDLELKQGEYEAAVRFTGNFLRENKEFPKAIAKIMKRHVLVEVWDRRFAYFDPKFEFNFIDSMDKAAALSTVQIDHENGRRFGINYVGKDGKRKIPFILHNSPSGAIERCIYAMLEKAHMQEQRGEMPRLPLWLSPVQVRFCPVSGDYAKGCLKLAEKMGSIRADIDDRNESVQKKIRDAEMEWIPYIIVFGKKEKKGKLSVRIRSRAKPGKPFVKAMDIAMLKKEIDSLVKGKPFLPLPLPQMMSRRPIFRGTR